MTRFYVGGYVPYLTTDLAQRANEWFCAERSDMRDWIDETVGDRWSIHPEFISEAYSELAICLDFVEVYVVYEEDQHAILHKLRWE